MRRIRISFMTLISLLLVSFTACQMREIAPIDDQAHITIDVDWSELEELPSGMTVYFYPENGQAPYRYYTNDVLHINKSLPEMNYEILLFNQTIEEFSSVNFRGMDNINTAEIYLPETDETISLIDKLYRNGGRAYSSSKQLEPRLIAAGRGSSAKPTRGYVDNKVIKPEVKIGQLTATIYVKGLNNVKRTNGALSGLANGVRLGLEQLNDTTLIQEMHEWTIDNSDSIGSISTVIGTFGLSPNIKYSSPTKSSSLNGSRFVAPMEEDDYRNILYLNFLLKDNTYVSYRFDVTDHIKNYTTNASVELVLDLGTDVEQYITIPETGIPYEEVPVVVQPWGDKNIEHNITL